MDAQRRLRRWGIAGAALLTAATLVIVMILAGDDDGDGSAVEPTSTAGTEPVTSAPVTTGTPSTSSPATSSPATSSPVTTSTVPVVAVPVWPVGAVDGNGDAVLVAEDGGVTVLYDGTDWDDPPPQEGETVLVSGVVALPEGARALVGLCCEPVPGVILPVDLATLATGEPVFGHAPSIGPTGDRLVRISYDTVIVSDLALADLGSFATDGSVEYVVDAALIDGERVAMVVVGPTGTTLEVRSTGAGARPAPVALSDATWFDAPGTTALAGVVGDTVYVLGVDTTRLTAYSALDLSPTPDADVVLPGPAISAWITPTRSVRWVDTDRRLSVDGVEIPGEYVWVR